MINALISMGLSFALSAVASLIKNPQSKATEKGIMLHIYQTCQTLVTDIKAQYPSDPDFS